MRVKFAALSGRVPMEDMIDRARAMHACINVLNTHARWGYTTLYLIYVHALVCSVLCRFVAKMIDIATWRARIGLHRVRVGPSGRRAKVLRPDGASWSLLLATDHDHYRSSGHCDYPASAV